MSSLARRILAALYGGPLTTPQICTAIDGSTDPMRQSKAYDKVYRALALLHAQGHVLRQGGRQANYGAPITWRLP